ncbi:MAG: sugar ABC transporter substrate-binding protein [Anaerolineae bacterium]|nr:sugar ABC transporter substrate-binding protein [Anaerolineae bacterium]
MRKFRGLILFAITASLLLTTLSGCLDLSFIAPQEPVTITFFTFGGEEYFEGLLEQFNKEYPHISVEIASGFSFFRSGFEDVDVLMGSNNNLSFLQQNDFPMSLNALISEDEDFDLNAFYRSGVDAFSMDGQRWGIPIAADITVMLYNKRLFDEANVPYPTVGWTWNDFLERAIALSDPDSGQFGYAYQESGGFGLGETMIMMYQWGGGLFDDLQSPTKMTINRPENVAAMEFYADLLHKYHVAPRMGERPSPYPGEGIESEKYAMWVGSISDEYDFDVGVAPLPAAEFSYTMGTVIGLYISNESVSPEASWAWVRFLSEQAIPGLIPMRQSLAESDEVANSLGEDALAAGFASLPNLLSLSIDFNSPLGSTWGTAMGAYNSALGLIRAGEPVQVTLDAAQKKSGF